MLIQHLSFVCLVCFVGLYGMFIWCYYSVIEIVQRAACLVEKSEKMCSLKRQVTHISFYLLLLLH
jgi:hypothetical protein